MASDDTRSPDAATTPALTTAFPFREPFDPAALGRLMRSNQDYYSTHGEYVPALAGRLLEAKAIIQALEAALVRH